jgi:hypothetical protein
MLHFLPQSLRRVGACHIFRTSERPYPFTHFGVRLVFSSEALQGDLRCAYINLTIHM